MYLLTLGAQAGISKILQTCFCACLREENRHIQTQGCGQIDAGRACIHKNLIHTFTLQQSNFVFVLMGPWGKAMILRLFVKAPLVTEEQPSESVWMKPFPSVTIQVMLHCLLSLCVMMDRFQDVSDQVSVGGMLLVALVVCRFFTARTVSEGKFD